MTARQDRGVETVTFGCRLNIVESEAMQAAAMAAGHKDLVIVNTCAVTAEAARQARQTIRRLGRENPERPIAVTGCAAEIDPHGFRAMPEVTHLVANRGKGERTSWVALGSPSKPLPSPERSTVRPAPANAVHTRGFLEVQNGCDHRCTFCVIPFGRGASRSVPVSLVLERARAMVDKGVKEIVLTGVDITSFGADLADRPRLGALVKRLLGALPDLPRLRLSSLDCIEADEDLLDVIASEPRFMPHLHLSLQSGADLILKRMKRRHLRADAITFCHTVRALRPDMVFGADLIVGFPTESDALFAESLSLIEACGLTHLHVFPYSPRPGTPATRMPPVPREQTRERASLLREAGEVALRRHLSSKVGRTVPLLMERGGKGRAEDFTAVRVETAPPAGSMVDVRVTGHDGRELTGSPALA